MVDAVAFNCVPLSGVPRMIGAGVAHVITDPAGLMTRVPDALPT